MNLTMPTHNPVLDELRAVRERLLSDAGGTLEALVDRLQSEEQRSNHPRYAPRAIVHPDVPATSAGFTMHPASPPKDEQHN
jgi:hypothetical protein